MPIVMYPTSGHHDHYEPEEMSLRSLKVIVRLNIMSLVIMVTRTRWTRTYLTNKKSPGYHDGYDE